MSSILLIGMPMCGKSTNGRLLSKNLKLSYMDTDEEIQRREGINISSIFLLKGQNYFRNLESSILDDVKLQHRFVISTGGGLPMFSNNMEKLKRIGTTIFLNTPLNILEERIKSSHNRPLLINVSKNTLSTMYNKRLKVYQNADYTIDCENKIPEEICKLIEAYILLIKN